MKKQNKSEAKDSKIIKKWTEILKDMQTVDEAVFELKKMAYQYNGNLVQDLVSNKIDFEDEQNIYNQFLEKRAKIIELLTKEY